MILKEWNKIKNLLLDTFVRFMKTFFVFDGWDCYSLEEATKHNIEYHSIEREI
jgi:UDPglucose 6-dehydrogenase